MAKCPYCGSRETKSLNLGQRVIAGAASGITAVLLSPFLRGDTKYPAKEVHESICKVKKYICVNCGRKFEESVF